MIFVYCKLTPKPECIPEFLTTVTELVDRTRTEDGCFSFELVQEDGGDSYALIEKFRDRLAIAEHVAFDYFEELFPRLKALLCAEPQVTNHILIH